MSKPLLTTFFILFLCVLSSAYAQTSSQVQGELPVATIVFIGDSLTQGLGVKKEEAYPEVLERILKAKGRSVKVVNGGISGSVTADADRRMRWYLKLKPKVIVLVLGANDALKGTAPDLIKKNLQKALQLAQKENQTVLLAGMKIFSNYGEKYAHDFAQLYIDLAREFKANSFVPFILEAVALKKDLMQSDGKHPNAKGHEAMAKTLLPYIEQLL